MKVLPIKPEIVHLKWVKELSNLPEIKFNSWKSIEITSHSNRIMPFWNHRKPFLFIIPAKSSWIVEISNQQGKTTYSTNNLYDLVIAAEGNLKITADKRNDNYSLVKIERK